MGGLRSRNKGKRGERELKNILKTEYGYKDARRNQQYCGADGDADVVGLPGLHIECKRDESLDRYKAIEQAESEAREGEVPVVMHRKNNCEWLAYMTYRAYEVINPGNQPEAKKIWTLITNKKRMNVYDMVDKADIRKTRDVSIVVHMVECRPEYVYMKLESFMTLYREYEAGLVIADRK